MGQLIDLAEVRKARARRAAVRQRENLAEAVRLVELNLSLATERLETARFAERLELLDRTYKLAAVVDYGHRLLFEAEPGTDADPD